MGMFEHPNAALVERLYAAFDAGDAESLKKLIAEDAVWHVPGSTEISGDHRGHEAIFAYFQKLAELSGGTFWAGLVDVLPSDMHAAGFAAAIGGRGGRGLEPTCLLFLRVSNDRVVGAPWFNEDAAAFMAVLC